MCDKMSQLTLQRSMSSVDLRVHWQGRGWSAGRCGWLGWPADWKQCVYNRLTGCPDLARCPGVPLVQLGLTADRGDTVYICRVCLGYTHIQLQTEWKCDAAT